MNPHEKNTQNIYRGRRLKGQKEEEGKERQKYICN